MPTHTVFGHEGFALCMQPLLPFEGDSIAIGVSGGSDSIALALLAHHWAKQHQLKIIALTVDHGLRPESENEARHVKQWLTPLGIEHHTLIWEGKKPTSNIQEEARKKRYELLIDWCKQHNVKHLLTAHHLDDQAETVAMRLARGSGVDGLSGIPAVSNQSGIRILRPLLGIPKSSLQTFLIEQGQAWIEDPSNQSDTYARSTLRAVLNSYADATLITKRLADTAHHMARVRNYLEIQTDNAEKQCVTLHPEGYATLNRERFLSLHEEIALRLLSNLLCTISGNPKKTRFSHLETLYHTLQHAKTATLHGCKITPNKDKAAFLVYREFAAIPPKTPIPYGDTLLWDNRFSIKLLKNKSNYYIAPLGSFNWPELYSRFPGLKKSPVPKPVLKTLPILRGVENTLELPHIIVMGGGDSCWDMVFKPLKP